MSFVFVSDSFQMFFYSFLVAGAKHVILSDREPLALQCALLSARASGLSAPPPPPLTSVRSFDPILTLTLTLDT